MKNQNVTQNLAKNPSGGGTTAPVTYRSTAAVYRSLAAVPAQFDVEKHHARGDKQFAPLLGPQTKSQGDVVWGEAKTAKKVDQEIQPVPIPLIVANAPHNAVYLESNPVSKVVLAVHALFDQHLVDYEYDASKHKWKCACYDAQVETRFVSRLFSVPGKMNYFVLDFQRRSGDAFHFISIYKAINFKLLKSGFVVGDPKTQTVPEMRTFKPMALPIDFCGDDESLGTKGEDSKEYEPLCKMCTSPYIDVQREGLAALACRVESSESARKSLAGFAEKLMEAVSLSRDTQVRRLAVTALAGLTFEPACHSQVKDKGGLRVIASIVVDPNELPETRRQAARLLGNIPMWDEETDNLVKRAYIAKDTRLAELVTTLKARLN
jgi:hypothetical protein